MTLSNTPFVGRLPELNELNLLKSKKSASLVVIKGRRRIGKSRLIEEFARRLTFYEFSGLSPEEGITDQQQRDHFSTQLAAMTGLPVIKTNDWTTLFLLLAREVEKKEAVILFDEISWMGSHDPTFLGKLKVAWDLHFKKNPKTILILCGSVSSWINDNILKSKLFMGRVSLPMTLKELSIPVCNQLFEKMGCMFSPYEKFKILSVTGGVPRYLEEIHHNLSGDENIKRLCFSPNGILLREFEDIFTDIFSTRSETYKKIVSMLIQGSSDLGEISKQLKLSRGGHLSDCLDELCEAGIVDRNFTWNIGTGKESTLSQYRLQDNYIRFYLKYIEPNLGKIEQNHYQSMSLSSLPNWSSIMGLQFENLVLKNRSFILQELHIVRENIIADNPFFQRKTQRQAGCQIDYLIHTRENTLYVCEIKFSKHVIKSAVIEEIREKVQRLIVPKGYAILPVLIHVNGVDDTVEDSGYFYKIIDFAKLLTQT